MKINEVPEEFKIYNMTTTNGSQYLVNGLTKQNIVNSRSNWVELENGSTIQKPYIIEFKLNNEETRLNVQKNKPKLLRGGEN